MEKSLVIGATGIVGGYIVRRLSLAGGNPLALSRSSQKNTKDVTWFQGDLSSLHSIDLPSFETLYCTANIGPLADALRKLGYPSLKRVVVFTSTSIITKIDSEIEAERTMIRRLARAEQELIATCEELGIGWTILRPTLIYAEGRDANISRLARFISSYRFIPLAGSGKGLRQPVHAEDLAIGAVAAASSQNAVGKIYSLPGTDIVSYREMVCRIFDSLQRPRRVVSVPPILWRAAFTMARPLFPNANAAMGLRMDKDMVFDPGSAIEDFGWSPRKFYPKFGPPIN
jgi:uncharacterized protein YbjT (DUF2867 family)